MLALAHPEALVLAIPAAAAWWWLRPASGRWWRGLVLGLLVLVASGPRLTDARGGSDVVLVLDRSASMGEARAVQGEYLRLVGDQRRDHDRLAVVLAGDGSAIAQVPHLRAIPDLAQQSIADSGSDLDGALRTAASLIPGGRTGRVILVSDGEGTSGDPRAAAAMIAAAGITLDVLPVVRPGLADAAVAAVDLPGAIRLGESFLGTVRLVSDRRETRAWTVSRGNVVIARGTARLLPGREVAITFSDRPPVNRLVDYAAELDAADDRQPANNRAVAAVRVAAAERVLVLGGDGTPGNVARALQAAGLAVQTRAEGPIGLGDLAGVGVLVLEQTPGDRLGRSGMQAIAQWVQHLGGGLVVTGGRRGFGVGGWYESPLETVLPVTMELRDEHRKLSVAMVIALDRSGSMAVPVAGGRTKMELADEGAMAAIELMGPRDQVAVFAVDTAAHPIVPLTRIDTGREAILSQVHGIVSEGGGIYIGEALEAAGSVLASASAGTRHLVLFADANDSEEPGAYQQLLADFRKAGITVSVVAMGSRADADAKLLDEVAALGGGRIVFAADVLDLPRLFAQETMLVARTAWVDQRVSPAPTPLLSALIPGVPAGWPAVGGYNLTYPRERTQVLAWCPGDPKAPAVAAWNIGTGRSVALPFDVDGPDANGIAAWPGYGPLIAGAVRFAAGDDGGGAPAVVSARRHGRTVDLRLEVDPRLPGTAVAGELTLIDATASTTRAVPLIRVEGDAWTARIELPDERTLIPAATVDGKAIWGPALRLPMPPEVAPRLGLEPGHEVLAALARIGGGQVRETLVGAYANPPSPGLSRDLAWILAWIALAVAVVEIAWRRFGLTWPGWLRIRRGGSRAASSAPTASGAGPGSGSAAGVAAAPSSSSSSPDPVPVPPAFPEAPSPAQGDGLADALATLKRRRGG